MNIAFPAGLLLALAPWLLPTPEGLDPHAWHALGIMLAMALWWLTEIIPLAATALVPLAIFPLIGASSFATTASSYANPLIMLFLGGFMIARAVEKWGLHIRVSSWIMGFAGRSPAGIVGGLMVATAFLSLWISNTASAMIMVPVAAAAARGHDDRFAAAALLGVAYAATIGGLGSLIGTPPNALFAAYMEEAHGITIGFAQWAAIGLPTTFVLLPVAWFVLTRIAFPLERSKDVFGEPVERRVENLPCHLLLAARKAVIQASLLQTCGVGQHAKRRAGIADLPENKGKPLDQHVVIQGLRPCHNYYRTFVYLLFARTEPARKAQPFHSNYGTPSALRIRAKGNGRQPSRSLSIPARLSARTLFSPHAFLPALFPALSRLARCNNIH